jgi:two-component system sensor histidine kinase AlgZ
MNRLSQRLARLAALVVGPALVATLMFSGVSRHTPWRAALEAFLIACVFSLCIGPACTIVLPRVGTRVRHLARPWYWTAMVASMLTLAAAGSLVALLLLTAAGLLNIRQVFAEWFANSLRVSVIVTLTVGILITMFETLRSQLTETQLALRTKQRDEAEARRLAAEAQFASLESRVHPHFLFNTLNSIAALIPKDPAGAEKMTEQLASLLRSSLDAAPASLVPLEQELKVVRDYLDIERVRFGPRLRYDITSDGEVSGVAVPRLSLQTLVENCVKYAVAPRREGGSIVICVGRTNERVRLSVSDDGPGFASDLLPAGHGLELIRARLATIFGTAAELSIAARPGHTTVSIELPA